MSGNEKMKTREKPSRVEWIRNVTATDKRLRFSREIDDNILYADGAVTFLTKRVLKK